jgi:hypothetical protein
MKWIRASDKMPVLYPVNATSELHYKLDGRKVDGFFLHSRCFEYFDNSISGYRQLEVEDFGRIEWLDESQSSPVEQMREAQPLIDRLQVQINSSDESDNQDAISWGEQIGVLLSVNEARAIIKALSLPATQDEQKELEQLRAWKQEAMRVMADFQEIGKEIGVPLGQSIGDKILPYIKDCNKGLQDAIRTLKSVNDKLSIII